MADGLSIASSVIALIAFAFKSSTVLYTTVRDFQSQDKNVRALKNELSDLRGVLESLANTVDNNSNVSFDALKLPLLRCGKTCEEYGALIARRMVSLITPDALEEYKDLIRDTSSDLQEHMTRLDERVRALVASEADGSVRDAPEWMAMVEEKQTQIEQLESASKEHPQFLQQPSAHKFIRSGLGIAKGSIQSLVSQLQTHENDIDKRMESMRSTVPLSEHEATQLAQLQETKESLRQCMSVVADAGETLTNERCNIFEDITMADSSYGISVSTVKDLVVARRLNLSGQARYLGGQISDESYQKTIDGLTHLDLESAKSYGKSDRKTSRGYGCT
ncbi:uncharacterized protein NECHADRAFT_98466 [Fusarium vanettenii 77-13-4]|uniref:Azaphilone pigments biosynthesis cluster protein L N-terminal domain-containing protein n=1 Tax=Fusarium vanettenii (strain ATCC MYA-4622 / CBS 123669 / FGSC 9596 / NRRL 45880 / 77-13-4) TaxID=660122 RepID=C7ZRE1_FUSV7|nr:uncharacterized protein NECHADRAFT_98466 [Fusarium vanettenii 77-13-4]EEU33417.1 hypothetical protein NECHADRAFT_98466 [Fusarium vanettenii 77-13-4]